MRARCVAFLICGGALVTASNAAAAVSFFPREYPAPESDGFVTLTSGDFNGDGKRDLVTLNAGSVSFLAGVGDGTFLPPIASPLGPFTDRPVSIVAADLNRDGSLDLAVGYSTTSDPQTYSTMITIHLGDGTGAFSTGVAIATGPNPGSLAVADITRDGKPDLIVAAQASAPILIHPGRGDGTFDAPIELSVSPYRPSRVVAADVNHDGYADVIALCEQGSDGALMVWFDAASPATPAVTPLSLRWHEPRLAVGDVNGDGRPDAVVSTFAGGLAGIQGSNELFTGQPDGHFVFVMPAGGLGQNVLADFNGDGDLDVAGGSFLFATFHKTLTVSLGNGVGGFARLPDFDLASGVTGMPWPMLADDFNGDGKPDIIAAGLSTGADAFTVLINASPPGCRDKLAPGYAAGRLDVGFRLRNAAPATWGTWLVVPSGVFPLWSFEIPAVATEVSFNVPIPGFPSIGSIGLLTAITRPADGFLCGDLKIVDTGP